MVLGKVLSHYFPTKLEWEKSWRHWDYLFTQMAQISRFCRPKCDASPSFFPILQVYPLPMPTIRPSRVGATPTPLPPINTSRTQYHASQCLRQHISADTAGLPGNKESSPCPLKHWYAALADWHWMWPDDFWRFMGFAVSIGIIWVFCTSNITWDFVDTVYVVFIYSNTNL